jgi:uncharacterized protein YndB with AHSA1/START domain
MTTSREPDPALERKLPFHYVWPIVAGALVGIAIRFAFSGSANGIWDPMMAAFIFCAPLVVGAVTVYVAERRQRMSVGYYIAAPAFASMLFVAGTLVINIEGIICAILIVPLFCVVGIVGGLLMGMICRLTNWPKHATYSIAALPFLFAMMEHGAPLPERIADVQREIHIAAPPSEVWRQINDAEAIRPDEVDSAWMYRIGVPVPVAGVTTDGPDGRVRKVTMGKGIHFDQRITDWVPGRCVRFDYDFQPDSFPPRALDDHVRIGGEYFDLVDTSYRLTPKGDATVLTVRMRYRVSTQFNWYAEPIARWLVGDFEETILGFYRKRSESGFRAGITPLASASPNK